MTRAVQHLHNNPGTPCTHPYASVFSRASAHSHDDAAVRRVAQAVVARCGTNTQPPQCTQKQVKTALDSVLVGLFAATVVAGCDQLLAHHGVGHRQKGPKHGV